MSYDPASGGQQQPGQGWSGQPPQYPPPGGYGQQPPPPGWGGGPPQGPTGPAQANLFSALFDFSFNSFATPALIKIVYIVGTALLVLGWLGFTITTFATGEPLLGLLAFVGGAIVVLFYIAFLRLVLEFYYAVVRMSEDIHNRR